MAGKIFINYRRKLNLMEARLLKKVLERHFGTGRVFLDESGLEGGKHWPHMLEAQVDAAAAMVSLIPKGWAAIADENGARRLDNQDDFVRFEIARAFTQEIPFLPARLDGADMPTVAELPPNLALLPFKQAMLLRNESFDADADRIAARLKGMIPRRKMPYWAVGAIAASALLAGIATGPSVLTGLGFMQDRLDADLRAERHQARKQTAEAEASRKDAKAKYDAAADERDRAQAALKTAQDALSTEQAKAVAANARAGELAAQLKAAEQRLIAASNFPPTPVTAVSPALKPKERWTPLR